MPIGDHLRNIGLDRYDINARLKPALLALLPAFIVVGFWFPQARTLTGVGLGIVTTCGVTYLMAQTVRRLGRAVERSIGEQAGRLHSARLLTHSDTTFAAETKARYHAYLENNGLNISSLEEERLDPNQAFERARSAVDWLLNHTRPTAKQSLLFDENIAYGFYRNLYGIKPLAIGIVIAAATTHVALMVIAPLDATSLRTGALVAGLLVALLALWLFFVSGSVVTDASLAYAEKLFSQCESPAPVASRQARSSKESRKVS
ncbi:hypothetical protein [Hyphomicrobium sp. MC1]|uniref:hypothetical protein n=1 Tax=Hyphomicrobium sp. (strain MC1) TaxID=717785 RepID=UPI000213F1F4|nr:hypothetical protein [Hyphomicrobium sp. MC1]CCB65517.1 conserved membrane protein of unknown function [Hyphomicrobium sp. MC1]